MMKMEVLNTKIRYGLECVTIVDSYKITKTEDMYTILCLFKKIAGYYSKRTVKSWVKEWKAHNRLYKLGLFKSHTKDCDLEENEKIHRLIAYQILGI